MRVIKVGSRESTLGVIQAEEVIKAIEAGNRNIRCELVTMSSQGDKDHSKPLDEFQSPTLFTNCLDEALAKGDIDISVHSYKDLPIYSVEDFPIVAVGKRENPFDCLVLPSNFKETWGIFGCSCKRRKLQFERLYPQWKTGTIRGSVVSRLEQMDKGIYDGLILAVAGLKRLGMESRISHVFTLEEMVPSACQGIIAVQGRKEEDHSYLEQYHHEETRQASTAERSFVEALYTSENAYNNGVYANISSGEIKITGMIILPDNGIITREISGDPNCGVELGEKLGKRLLMEGKKQWAI